MSDTTPAFNAQACWHPVLFLEDLAQGELHAFSLHGQRLVLLKGEGEQLSCFEDRCPHRAARLSDGVVVDGQIECRYHGWRFDGQQGQCRQIPQWPAEQALPPRTCLRPRAVVARQGLAWVWSGPAGTADPARLPLVEALEQPGMRSVDYAVDLPYDHSFLIENVIDVAHIHIIHDGIRGGGHRAFALPLDFEVLEEGPQGLRAQYRTRGLEALVDTSAIERAAVDFIAPGLIHYRTHYKRAELVAGLALYALPLAPGRCRLLYRKYSNFTPRREALKPRWLEHWTQNTILAQDMALLIGQAQEIEQAGQPLQDLWQPIRTSDTLVLRYRRWLDQHGAGLPGTRGLRRMPETAAPAAAPAQQHSARPSGTQDFYNLHTRHCASCRRMHQRLGRAERVALGALLLVAPVLLAEGWPWLGLGAHATALGAWGGLRWWRRRFEWVSA
jgi:phenylpropionate dioxygenase-like ring-hydroxylating dioxygenase large terminal subunit